MNKLPFLFALKKSVNAKKKKNELEISEESKRKNARRSKGAKWKLSTILSEVAGTLAKSLRNLVLQLSRGMQSDRLHPHNTCHLPRNKL